MCTQGEMWLHQGRLEFGVQNVETGKKKMQRCKSNKSVLNSTGKGTFLASLLFTLILTPITCGFNKHSKC